MKTKAFYMLNLIGIFLTLWTNTVVYAGKSPVPTSEKKEEATPSPGTLSKKQQIQDAEFLPDTPESQLKTKKKKPLPPDPDKPAGTLRGAVLILNPGADILP
ncbi:hypothetical protein [Adhaeribacter aquaticus]|uniref:hypothetical protein n=1 Tax=Adhaeribacter aquaticus TaxID=299567 RepID=UPI00040C4636|nr:hypothetical protein [Adhaeribacter aquaticus]